MTPSKDIVIVAAKRTPMGAFQGAFSGLSGPHLGSIALRGTVDSIGLQNAEISEVYMGCVLQGGLGQAPARQASLKAGLSSSIPCTTLNKVCGSGLKSIMLAADALQLNPHHTMILAGGMESMTQAPYLLAKGRSGYRLGHSDLKDLLFCDGLEDAETGQLMGHFAEETAQSYGFTREDQDAFAIESCRKSLLARDQGLFAEEIVPMMGKKEGDLLLHDEPLHKINMDKIPLLKPAFSKTGTITAANASSLADGAAAVLLTTRPYAETLGLDPLVVVKGYVTVAQAPQWFTTAPIQALTKLSDLLGWSLEEVDHFEINEAFAVVAMAAMKDHRLPPHKVNPKGGACALGHPLGASGARLVVTLAHALKGSRGKKGIATLCIGGGEAVAIALEGI